VEATLFLAQSHQQVAAVVVVPLQQVALVYLAVQVVVVQVLRCWSI
jgi:hypothetical protein